MTIRTSLANGAIGLVVTTVTACGTGGDGGSPAPTPTVVNVQEKASSTPCAIDPALTAAARPATTDMTSPRDRRVLRVGPGHAFTTPSQAARVAQDGDTIEIQPGTYTGDVAVWTKNGLTIRGGAAGSSARAVLDAAGASAQGKAIWVVQGKDTVIENIEFRHARVPDQNGAGIRAEGANLHLRNTAFFDNENGVLAAGNPLSTITVERSEFARNGRGDGYTHNLYVNHVHQLIVRDSYFHETQLGHNLKSRARISRVHNSFFGDLANGAASYQLDFPNGGQIELRGNTVQKGVLAQNFTMVAIGEENGCWPSNSVALSHNTLVAADRGLASTPKFLMINGIGDVRTTANLFIGPVHAKRVIGIDESSIVSRDDRKWLNTRLPAGAEAVLDLRPAPGDLTGADALVLTVPPDSAPLTDDVPASYPPSLPLITIAVNGQRLAGARQFSR